jgi:predicted nucleotidyltransferase
MKPHKPLDWKEIKNYTKNLFHKVIKPLLIMMMIFFAGLVLVALFTGCNKWTLDDYEPDNAIEELAEEIIKQKLDLIVDLTPNSPEDINP